MGCPAEPLLKRRIGISTSTCWRFLLDPAIEEDFDRELLTSPIAPSPFGEIEDFRESALMVMGVKASLLTASMST